MQMNFSRTTQIISYIAICLVAVVLRLYHLGFYSLWMDEVMQVRNCMRADSISQVIKFATYQCQTPLDYMIGYAVAKFIPFSEFSARFPSFLFGSGTILLACILARRLFNSWTSVLAGLALALSTILIYFSQEARPYSIFFFFLLALLITFFWIIDSCGEKGRRWVIFTFLAALLLITRSITPVTALIALNVAFLLSMLIVIAENKKCIYPFSLRVLRNLVISTMVAGLSFIPFFLKVRENSQRYIVEAPWTRKFTWDFFKSVEVIVGKLIPYNMGTLTIFLFVGFLFGAYFIIKQRKNKPNQFIFFLFCLIEPILFAFALHAISNNVSLRPRYLVQTVIPIYIIGSYGYYELLRVLSGNVGRKVKCVICALPILVVLYMSVQQLPAYYSDPKPDYRGAVEYLRTIYNNEDVAVYDTFREHGRYEPGLKGRGVYFGKKLKIRQYKWGELVDMLEEGFQTKGRVFLFIHAGKAGGPPITNSDALVERNFEQMAIIYAKDKSLSLKETVLLYIDEMLKSLRNDSSRVDLYLAKAKLLLQDSPKQAQENVELAEALLARKE